MHFYYKNKMFFLSTKISIKYIITWWYSWEGHSEVITMFRSRQIFSLNLVNQIYSLYLQIFTKKIPSNALNYGILSSVFVRIFCQYTIFTSVLTWLMGKNPVRFLHVPLYHSLSSCSTLDTTSPVFNISSPGPSETQTQNNIRLL